MYVPVDPKDRPVRCNGCPFKTLTCGTRGPVDSPFVIVGESPGSAEVARNQPFVGPSGKMLNDVLSEVGFDSLGVEPFITNALQCYPMGDKMAILGGATSSCQGRLRQQIMAHPRKVVLALGAAASWSLTNNFGLKITRDRGKVFQIPELASEGVVITVHPAYLMRNGGGLPFWKKDLKTAVDLFSGDLDSIWKEPTWEVIQTRQHLEWTVEQYIRADFITGDYETDGLHALFNRVLSLGITKDGRHIHIIPERIYYDNVDLIKRLMEHPHPKWNWHNGKFDIQFSWATDQETGDNSIEVGVNARVDHDTMLLSYANNENKGFHDLDQTAQTWIQAPAHKSAMDHYYKEPPHYSLRNAPPEELYRYQAFDVAKTHLQFKPMYAAICSDPALSRLYYHTLIPAVPFFARMERYGVEVDVTKVKENIVKEDELIAQINGRLQKYAIQHLGREINFNSYIQVRELLYKAMKLGPLGCIWDKHSSDEDALVEIQRRTNHPIIHDMLEHREVVKRKGTYVQNLIDHYKKVANRKKPVFCKGLIKPDGRIHASFLLHGTTTGRPACKDPNLLNQPRGQMIRSQYKARPGYVFVEVDENQAELRSLAELSNDPILVDIYTKNEVSIHDVTTASFFGSLQQMMDDPAIMHTAANLMQYFGERTPKLVYKEAKMAGKTVNFGIVYGREAHSIAQVFNVSHQLAQEWIDKWFETYRVAGDYIKRCRDTVLGNQTMVTPWGRKKRVGVVTAEKLKDLQNQAANFPHQSIAHDILLEAAIECEPRLLHEWGARPWNEVYDAIYYEIEADNVKLQESIQFVQETIVSIPPRYGLTRVPFIAEAKVGVNWGQMFDWKGSLDETMALAA